MTPGIRPLVAGNWKMNGLSTSLDELSRLANGLSHGLETAADVVVCVPDTLVYRASERMKSTDVRIGGQDCHAKDSGAHTGDTSASMLKDAGATAVIVGHSERRTDHHESDADVHAKADAAWAAGLQAIICIGETRTEREEGHALEVLTQQLHGSLPSSATAQTTVIAYEPVWAIGTGLTPTIANIAQAHAHIRAELRKLVGEDGEHIRILYGGSVKPANAGEILAVENVDGALVGGASLKAADLLGIIESYQQN